MTVVAWQTDSDSRVLLYRPSITWVNLGEICALQMKVLGLAILIAPGCKEVTSTMGSFGISHIIFDRLSERAANLGVIVA